MLREIVRVLNEGSNQNLVQLVRAWQEAQTRQPNRFELKNGPLPAVLKMKFPAGCPTWNDIDKRCRVTFVLSATGAVPSAFYVGRGTPWTEWDYALHPFVQLLGNPDRDLIAGPCARCGKYYVKKRASQKVYCSRTCGNAATAVVRAREKWDKQRGDKIELAATASRKWSRLKTAEPFKKWAEKHYPGRLTPKFITRNWTAIEQEAIKQAKGAN